MSGSPSPSEPARTGSSALPPAPGQQDGPELLPVSPSTELSDPDHDAVGSGHSSAAVPAASVPAAPVPALPASVVPTADAPTASAPTASALTTSAPTTGAPTTAGGTTAGGTTAGPAVDTTTAAPAIDTARRRAPRGLRPEWVFLPLFLLFGAAYIALIPVGWNSDEPAHLQRAEQIASGGILADVGTDEDGRPTAGGDVPNEMLDMLLRTRSLTGIVFDPTLKIDEVAPADRSVLGSATWDPVTFVDFRNTAIYSPVAYLPQMPAFWIGRAFGLSFFAIDILGRVLSLLAVAAAGFFAIRWTPVGKWALAAVALLPAVVSQSAAFGADAAVLAFALLTVALILRLAAAPRPPSVGQWVVLVVLAAGLGLAKAPYAAVALLTFAIPLRHRTPAVPQRWGIALLAVVLAVIPTLVWTALTSSANLSLNPAADFGAQVSFVLGNPVSFLGVLYRTFLTDQAPGLYTSMFGNPVWLSAPLPAAWILLATAGLTLAVVTGDSREVRAGGRGMTVPVRVWSLLVAGGVALVAAAAVYAGYTTPRAGLVDGFQGRYLLPALFLALIAVAGNRLRRPGSGRVALLILMVAVSVGGVLTVYLRLT